MEGALRASINFVTASQVAGAGVDVIENIKRTQINSLKLQFSRMRCDMQDGTRAMELLGSSPFSPDQRGELLTAVHTAVNGSTDGEAADGAKAQTNLYVYNYGPE